MYMLFAGHYYYPCGGSGDLYGTYETEELAIIDYKSGKYSWDWGDILNLSTQKWTRLDEAGEKEES